MNGFGFLISSIPPVAVTVDPLAVMTAWIGRISVEGAKLNSEVSWNLARIRKVNRCGLFGSAGFSGMTGPLNSNDNPPTGSAIDGWFGGLARFELVIPRSFGVKPSTTT